jgi:hypothetical protein
VLKKTLRRRIVKVLAMIEIVIYLLFGKVFRTTLIENDNVSKTAYIVPESTGGFTINGKTLF